VSNPMHSLATATLEMYDYVQLLTRQVAQYEARVEQLEQQLRSVQTALDAQCVLTKDAEDTAYEMISELDVLSDINSTLQDEADAMAVLREQPEEVDTIEVGEQAESVRFMLPSTIRQDEFRRYLEQRGDVKITFCKRNHHVVFYRVPFRHVQCRREGSIPRHIVKWKLQALGIPVRDYITYYYQRQL
jgi:hypothetical protein